ncbi:MAG TPA: M1 family metallopeptidase [Gemmatimonadota bacterium]|nr:M1 family metallopeptidase [Gemmatimonadota bacterium]
MTIRPARFAGALAVIQGLVLCAAPLPAQEAPGPEWGLPAVAVDGYGRRHEVDVLHYGIAIELPDSGRSIAGRTEILYEARAALDSLALDFGGLEVDSVRVDGRAAVFRHQRERLVIETPPTAPGARREVAIWYHGAPMDGLILGPNRHGDFVVFADNWPDRARYWFPGIDHPSDKATVRFDVTAPSWMEVIGNGYQVDRVELEGGLARTRWAETAEIPTYCMVIGAADFAITEAGEAAGIEVSHWTYPADSVAGAAAFSRSTEIVGFYDSLFGPYPYEKLAHVQSSTRYGGMENSSAIFYGEQAIAGADGLDALTSLVAHETVHQWFGDAVTEADWRHLWLSEGFATYFAAVFFEFHGGDAGRGPAELARRMGEMKAEVIEYYLETPEPVYGEEPREYESLLTPNNYQKGAWVLHMLRRQVGDEAFFAAIRGYYSALRDGTAWTADFERIAEEASGQDLGWFFAQWLGRAGFPVLMTEATSGEDGATRIVVGQAQPGEPYRLDVELEVRWEGGSRRERIRTEQREAVLEVRTPGPVEEIRIDPDGWLLHENGGVGGPESSAEAEPPGPLRASRTGGTALAGAG